MSINRAAATRIEVPRGLAGVVVTDTRIGDVRGIEGFYHYRHYSAVELAQTRGFEDVWHLLAYGELPDAEQSAAFAAETAALRPLPDEVRAALPAVAAASGTSGSLSGPLSGMRTALSLLGAAKGFRPVYDIDADARRRDTLVASAAVPTLLTALYRLGRGLDPVEPRDDLSYAANYLYMLTGSEPDKQQARAIEQYLISTIDHGFNASTFTARVIASTGADVAACLVGAVGALSGPLHGVRPAVPWTPWTRSEPRTVSTPGSANASSPGTASWASATRSTARRTPFEDAARGRPAVRRTPGRVRRRGRAPGGGHPRGTQAGP